VLYRGPIDKIRGRLRGRVRAADSDYDGGPTAASGHRLDVVAIRPSGRGGSSTEVVRTLAPLPGASLALVAAWRGHIEVLEVLLALQADPNRAANDGSTPLLMASGAGRADVVAMLLKAGAEPGLVKTGGFSPLWNAVVQHEHGGSREPWPQPFDPPFEREHKNGSGNRDCLEGCGSKYANSFAVRESNRLLALEAGKRPVPRPQPSSDPDSLATARALLWHGQRKVNAARCAAKRSIFFRSQFRSCTTFLQNTSTHAETGW
jgi:hypothetical protein